MLKLERRKVTDFLDANHQKAFKKRIAAAAKLAALPVGEKRSKSIRYAWNNFRIGNTCPGTCAELFKELCVMSFAKCALCEVPGPSTIEHVDEKAKKPARMFDWDNWLAACGDCNRHRENSQITDPPFDPSNGDDPLDYFGWSEHGVFAPLPAHKARIDAHVKMYNLARFNDSRKERLQSFKGHLFALTQQSTPAAETVTAIQGALKETTAWQGPIREYLLRPPTPDDEWLVDEALRRLPEIRTWVQPWLRPGKRAGTRWR